MISLDFFSVGCIFGDLILIFVAKWHLDLNRTSFFGYTLLLSEIVDIIFHLSSENFTVLQQVNAVFFYFNLGYGAIMLWKSNKVRFGMYMFFVAIIVWMLSGLGWQPDGVTKGPTRAEHKSEKQFKLIHGAVELFFTFCQLLYLQQVDDEDQERLKKEQ